VSNHQRRLAPPEASHQGLVCAACVSLPLGDQLLGDLGLPLQPLQPRQPLLSVLTILVALCVRGLLGPWRDYISCYVRFFNLS
jgi:hypothetical protein